MQMKEGTKGYSKRLYNTGGGGGGLGHLFKNIGTHLT